jgi:hypothetical protein
MGFPIFALYGEAYLHVLITQSVLSIFLRNPHVFVFL